MRLSRECNRVPAYHVEFKITCSVVDAGGMVVGVCNVKVTEGETRINTRK